MSIITILLYQHTLTILKYFGILIFDTEAIFLRSKLCKTGKLFLQHGAFLICLGGLVFFSCPIKTAGYAMPWLRAYKGMGMLSRRIVEVGAGISSAFPCFTGGAASCGSRRFMPEGELWQGAAAAVDFSFPNGKVSVNPSGGFIVTNYYTTTSGTGDDSNLWLWLAVCAGSPAVGTAVFEILRRRKFRSLAGQRLLMAARMC